MVKLRLQRGQSLVEFALITPILLVLTFGIIDLSRVFVAYAQSANATRQALRYAATFGYANTTVQNFRNCEQIHDIATVNFFADDTPGMDATIQYERNGTIYANCPANPVLGVNGDQWPAAASVDNGDRVVITVTGQVSPIVPIWLPDNFNGGSFPINFEGRRTIVKDIILATPTPTSPPSGGTTGGTGGATCDAGETPEPDSLPDDWELFWTAYNGDVCNYGPSDDPDADGCDMLCEYNFGGDPFNHDNTAPTETLSIDESPLVVDWLSDNVSCTDIPQETRQIALDWEALTATGSGDYVIANNGGNVTNEVTGYYLYARVPTAPNAAYQSWNQVGEFPAGTTSCNGVFTDPNGCFNIDNSVIAGSSPGANDGAATDQGDMRAVEYRVQGYVGSTATALTHEDTDNGQDSQLSFICESSYYRNSVASNFRPWNDNNSTTDEYDCTANGKNANAQFGTVWPSFTWAGVVDIPNISGWRLELKDDNGAWQTILNPVAQPYCGFTFDANAGPTNGIYGCFTDVDTSQGDKIRKDWDYLTLEDFRLVPVIDTGGGNYQIVPMFDNNHPSFESGFQCNQDGGEPTE